MTWRGLPGSRQGPETVPERGSAAARGVPWSWSTRGPTMKAGAGGAGEVRAAGQHAGFSSRREGGSNRGRGRAAGTSQTTPLLSTRALLHRPAHTHPPTSHKVRGPKESVLKFHFRCSCLEPKDTYLPIRLEEARGSVLTPTLLGLSHRPLRSRHISPADTP